jgi:hypothetical protein
VKNATTMEQIHLSLSLSANNASTMAETVWKKLPPQKILKIVEILKSYQLYCNS